MGKVTLVATVSDGTVTITGVPEDATDTRAYIHGHGIYLEKDASSGAYTFKLKPDTPSGTYPLTVVIGYKGIAYSAVIDIEVKNPDISAS